MKNKENIFTAICMWIAESGATEFTLVAGENFQREGVPDELLSVLAIARRNYPAPASDVLARHYNKFTPGQQSHADMVDGSTGSTIAGDVEVGFTVRETNTAPRTYEVEFKPTLVK